MKTEATLIAETKRPPTPGWRGLRLATFQIDGFLKLGYKLFENIFMITSDCTTAMKTGDIH